MLKQYRVKSISEAVLEKSRSDLELIYKYIKSNSYDKKSFKHLNLSLLEYIVYRFSLHVI